jgi:CHAT domain
MSTVDRAPLPTKNPKHYENFDLLIEPATGGYRARVITSPVGQAASLVTLPFDPSATPEKVGLIGGAIRAYQFGLADTAEPVTPLDPQHFGAQLFDAIFGGAIGVSLRRSLDLVRQQGAGLRIRLRLDDAPELAALPWEYLFDTTHQRFLVLSDETPIVRYLALPLAEAPLQTKRPLRLLVMMADASDVWPRLDSAAERARLESALADLVQRGDVEITWLAQATLRELQRTLRQGDFHLFHFIGHGWFDEANQTYGLILENAEGLGEPVDAERLGVLLHNHPTLRLAFLNACEGARLIAGQALGGVAHHLVQQGLPAVIAMQFPVSDQAAITLAHEFYSALADHYPVDAALTEARVAIYGQKSVMEWGTPVLFMRAPDGTLWQPKQEETMSKENQSDQGVDVSGFSIGGNARDIVIGVVGAGAKNAVVGQGNRQTIYESGAPKPDDSQALEDHFARLFALLNSPTIDPRMAGRAESNLETLKAELTKDTDNETPSAATISRLGDLLLDNVPDLTQALTELFGLPTVAKVLGKAGDAALQWWKGRLGKR